MSLRFLLRMDRATQLKSGIFELSRVRRRLRKVRHRRPKGLVHHWPWRSFALEKRLRPHWPDD